MPDIWELLKLSNTDLYNTSRPEVAELYAQGLQKAFENPEIKELLQARGLTNKAIGALDAPLSAVGIRQAREGREQRVREGAGPIGALEKAIQLSLGWTPGSSRRAGVGAADFLEQYGIGEGGAGSQLPEDVKDMWLIGKTDPVAAATQLASNFAPFFAGVGGAVAGLGKLGLTVGPGLRGGLTSMLAYALGGGGVNAVEQGGRALMKGEPIDPGKAAIEAGIWAAGGMPAGRAGAAVFTGAAAVALPAAMGRDVDWGRAGSEALFGAIFGNPRYREGQIKVKAEDLGDAQKELLTETANTAPPGPVREEAAARAAAIDVGKKNDVVTLQNAVEAGGERGLMARDALVSKSEKIVPPDAPKDNVLTPDHSDILTQLRGMTELEITTAREEARGPMRVILNNAWAMVNNKQMIDGSIFKGTPLEGAPTKNLGAQPATKDMTRNLDAAKQSEDLYAAAAAGDDYRSRLLKHLAPEWAAELEHAARRVEVLTSKEGAPLAELKEYQSQLDTIRAEIDAKLTGKSPFRINDVDQAKRVTESVMSEMEPAQLRGFSRDLPDELMPFEGEVRKMIADRMVEKPLRGSDPIQREIDQLAEALEQEGLILRGERVPVTEPRLSAEKRAIAESPQARRMAVSLQDLRREAANWNAQVHPIEEAGKLEGFEVVADGKSKFFPSLRAMRTFFEELSLRPARDMAGLELTAGQKGQAITHVGDGKIMTTDMVKGEQVVHPDLEAAAQHVAAQPAVPVAHEIVGEGVVPGMGGVPGAGSAPRPPLDWVNLEKMPAGSQVLGTAKNVLMDMQDAIGKSIPVFDSIWRPLMDSTVAKGIFQKPHIVALRKALSGVKASKYAAIQDIMIAGKARGKMAEAYDMTRGELRAMRNMERWYKNLLDLDDKGLQQFYETMKEARKANGDPSRMSPDWTFPAATAKLVDDMFAGNVRMDDKNVLSMAQEILMYTGRNKHMKESLSKAHRTLAMIDHKIAEARKIGGADKDKLNALVQARAYAGQFVDGVEHNAPNAAAQVSSNIQRHYKLLKKLGLVEGNEVRPSDVERWATNATSYMSGVAMSMRVALAARNFTQMMLNGPKVGFGNTFAAMGEAMTSAGRQKVKASGIMDVPTMYMMDELMTSYPSMVSNITKLQHAGLGLYRFADSANRAVSYLAAQRAIKRNAKLVTEGKWDEFLFRTGIIGDSPVFQARIQRQFKNATPEGMQTAVSKAAHEYGKHMAEETQYIYNRVNAPRWMQSLWGRFFGQFGLWSVGFTEYMRRNLGGFTNVALLTGNPVRMPLKLRYQRQFVLKTMAMRGAVAAGGLATGIGVYNWNMANPLVFEGGPGHQVLGDIVTLGTGSGDEFQQRVAKSNIQRFAHEYWNPWGAATHDLEQMMAEPDPLISLALGLGFNIKSTKDRLRERRQQ